MSKSSLHSLYRHSSIPFAQQFIDDNQIHLNYVIYFENLSLALTELEKELHIPFGSMPKLNISKDRRGYQADYTDELIEIVGNYFKDDIQLFGYTFDGSMDRSIMGHQEIVENFSQTLG
jgi:hypothetical protein